MIVGERELDRVMRCVMKYKTSTLDDLEDCSPAPNDHHCDGISWAEWNKDDHSDHDSKDSLNALLVKGMLSGTRQVC